MPITIQFDHSFAARSFPRDPTKRTTGKAAIEKAAREVFDDPRNWVLRVSCEETPDQRYLFELENVGGQGPLRASMSGGETQVGDALHQLLEGMLFRMLRTASK